MPHPESDASGYHFTDTVGLWRPSMVVDGGSQRSRYSQWPGDGTDPLPPGDDLLHASPWWPGISLSARRRGHPKRPAPAGPGGQGSPPQARSMRTFTETGCVFLIIYGEEP